MLGLPRNSCHLSARRVIEMDGAGRVEAPRACVGSWNAEVAFSLVKGSYPWGMCLIGPSKPTCMDQCMRRETAARMLKYPEDIFRQLYDVLLRQCAHTPALSFQCTKLALTPHVLLRQSRCAQYAMHCKLLVARTASRPGFGTEQHHGR
jgi:hypothetical protein